MDSILNHRPSGVTTSSGRNATGMAMGLGGWMVVLSTGIVVDVAVFSEYPAGWYGDLAVASVGSTAGANIPCLSSSLLPVILVLDVDGAIL